MSRGIKYFLVGLVVLLASVGLLVYLAIWGANTPDTLSEQVFYIDEHDVPESIANKLYDQGMIKRKESFIQVAKLMKYEGNAIKSGRYQIEPASSNRELLSLLRSGKQQAINLTFNNVRTIDELAGRIASQLLIDSIPLLDSLRDNQVITRLGFDEHNIMSMFIPNTYKIYWNTSITGLLNRLKSEHQNFWTESRVSKAKALNLEPAEVYALASIVEKETLAASEKNRIAGLYLNRLNRGILLQADPTVVFAAKDFSIRRVLNKHLAIDSPYNTYMYAGLPPGPIYMPDISTIDAVLNPEDHDYLFFCARTDNSGLHDFAKTNAQHAANARKYHKWLNSQRIYR